VFFTSTELLALAAVDSLVLVGQKRDPDKIQLVLCSCAGFAMLSADLSTLKSNSSSSAHWKLFHINYAGNEACFPEAFYKCSDNLFAWSEILKNGLLCGGV